MAHPREALVTVLLLFLCLSAPLLSGQSPIASRDMRDGLDSFKNGHYDKAILLFHNVILDPAARAEKPSAYLLIAKSYMAIGKLDEAEHNLEFSLANFPKSAEYPESLYQKGRLLFLQDDFENAILALQSFLSTYPKSTFAPSAWFWVGESLYGLGRLEDAITVYRKIVTDYPTSNKVEAAQYKLSLIQLQQKEGELAKLLRWSHEEFLRSIEEYQNREKTYEQAIASYQRRIAGTGAAEDEKSLAGLRQQLAAKTEEANLLAAQLARLSAKADAAAPAAAADVTPQAAELANLQRLLSAKQAALALKEKYLAWIEAGGEAAR
jgi:TolA-binding protein